MPQCFFDEVASKYMKNLLEKGVETSQAIPNIGRAIQRSWTKLFLFVTIKISFVANTLLWKKIEFQLKGPKKY